MRFDKRMVRLFAGIEFEEAMAKWLGLLTLLVVTGVTCSARGATYYVNNLLGSDRATGLSAEPQAENGPVRTLSAALARAGRADRIVLANTGEPYREMISLMGPHQSGLKDHPFVIQGNGAVLDGTVTAAPKAWQHVEGNVFAMRPRRLTYQQLFSDGKPLARATLYSKHEVPQLQPTEWALLDGQMFFRTEGNKIPADYELRHTLLQTGITLYNVRHVRIENLVIQGFQQDGVNAHELVRDCDLVDVDCRANGRAGLSVGGVSRVEAVRCNFYDNGRVQVRTEGLGELKLLDCDVDTQGAPAFESKGRSLMADGKPVLGH